ncbi:hypothetical protein B0J12DRAFT_720801 [Macrophomina phaseolina]|uniref:UDP-glucuronosyl/UDP-glucosyltransferase n=1 Tax=Macrophomina phaseolina TaxID=35725 RepID=A0ABQ8G0Z0_9PEZI|nr:hypothetical protein B0J12DRAFT_720801 [Macrophomina phaseolina]
MADSGMCLPDALSSEPPPSYQDATATLVNDSAEVRDDGRVDVDLDSRLGRTLSKLFVHPPQIIPPEAPPAYVEPRNFNLKLNIVIQVVGSRGDVQPFIALGNELQKHGHRVRLATHDAGLGFYPIGGDPTKLMAYMVKNPGLIPNMQSLRQVDIQCKRKMVEEMLHGCWRSCIDPDPVLDATFVADAIIANPPSFAHVHCAQALRVPVHLMFTMPWSRATAFPHPLANLKYGGTDYGMANCISYGIVEWMTWQGLGDVINEWRHSIDLKPVPITEAPSLAETLKIPFTYCWSPALVPKPADWPSYIDVCGFFFRDPPDYKASPELYEFLNAGPPPVYIGFGSIVIEDPEKVSSLLVEAVRISGVRAIISKGWSNLDGPPDNNIFYLGDCPHEWLFQHVSAVVHHGGAGKTACGLLNGQPTTIVPFFGDQPFWGNMVAAAGAGPGPIPHRTLTANCLAEAIRFCLTAEASAAARRIADKMRVESGVKAAVESFHANLPIERLRCELLPDQPAAWTLSKGKSKKSIKLSKLAAEVLTQHLGLDRKNLKRYESKPFIIDNKRWGPVTGVSSAAVGTSSDIVTATAGIFLDPVKEYRRGRSRRGSTSSHATTTTTSLHPLSTATSAISLSSSSSSSASSSSSSSSSPSKKTKERAGQGNGERSGTSSNSGDRGISGKTAGAMAAASGKSLGKAIGAYSKGVAVDVPLALTDGMRAVPALWGDPSGAAVAGKNFAYGMGEGLTDVFVQPYKGAREGTTGALLGLVAYPGQGIAKSLHRAAHGKTAKAVVKAMVAEGEWVGRKRGEEARRRVMAAYGALRPGS